MSDEKTSDEDEAEEQPKNQDGTIESCCGILTVFRQCDNVTLTVILFCNFIQGFEKFLDLNLLHIYKNVMKLEPAETTALMGMNAMPWSFKILYGFFSDNFLIFGTRRKGHMLMNIGLCMGTIIAVMFAGESLGKYFVTACVTLCQMTMAYNDTVTDGLTVQATKIGHEDFSERVNSLAYILSAVGQILGTLIAWVLDKYSVFDPFMNFVVYLVIQVLFFVSASMLNKSVEPDEQQIQEQYDLFVSSELKKGKKGNQPISVSLKLWNNLKLIGVSMMHPPIFYSVLFFIIRGCLIPNLDHIQYFFLTD